MSDENMAAEAVDQIRRRLGLVLDGEVRMPHGRSDFVCRLDGETILFIEMERPGQKHPCTNVVKYWPWLEESEGRRLILVQVFVGNKSRRPLTRWLANRLVREFGNRFQYIEAEAPLDAETVEAIAEVAQP